MRLHHANGALICALLIAGSGLLSRCSLASYSETKSFRDALEGRPMDEVISGPVDRDSSSYGDRTSSANNANQAAQMMQIAIPVNGNLDEMMQQRQQQIPVDDQQLQQKPMSPSGADTIERESAQNDDSTPIPETNEPKIMDSRSGRQIQRQLAAPMMQSSRPQMPAAAKIQRQQRPDYNSGAGTESGSPSNSETGFGDEQSKPATKTKGSRRAIETLQQKPIDAMDQPENGNDQQQQVESPNGQSDEQGKGYSQADQALAAKQRAVAAMLMSMNNGMKYSQVAAAMQRMKPASGKNQDHLRSGTKKPQAASPTSGSSMAQNMLMSLANKAAYLEMQQQRQQVTMAPQMMIPENGSTKRANQQSQQVVRQASMQPGAAMDRAYQRKPAVEKKMSPSMVNAMLNKMMTEQQAPVGDSYENLSKQNPVDMLMKSQIGADMLTSMMMNGASGATAGMPNAKREQYKRMMMATALMQQQPENAKPTTPAYGSEDQRRPNQMQDNTFGRKQGRANSRDYAAPKQTNAGLSTTTMSPVVMMMSMLEQAKQQQNVDGEQDQQQLVESTTPSFTSRITTPATKSSSTGRPNMVPYVDNRQQQTMESPRNSMIMVPMSNLRPMVATKGGNPSLIAPVNKPMGYSRPAAAPASSASATMSPVDMMMMSMMNNGDYSPMMTDKPAPRYNSNRNSENVESKRRKPPPPPAAAAMRMNGAYSQSAPSAMGASKGPADQQKEMLMAALMAKMNAAQKNGINNRPSPMNGFRQAFNQPQVQEQEQDQQQQTNDAELMATTTEYPSDAAMPRPKMSYPMQSHLDANGESTPARSYDANEDDDENGSTNQRDQYGAAPKGEAEPFAFDYKVEDPQGNGHYRKEESDKNGVVRGSYGYMDVSGIYRHVDYIADEKGFRANIKSNEPGLNGSAGSGSSSDGNRAGSANTDGSTTDGVSNNADDSAQDQSAAGNGQQQPSSSSSALANPGPTMALQTNAMGGSTADNQQKMLQQMMMMMPAQQQQQMQQVQQQQLQPQQQELNENGEK